MLWDVMFFSLMVGLGEQYLSLYALALNFDDTIAGWITTIPLLSGAMLQLITPWAVKKLGSHRRWVVGCVTVQGLSFIPLIISSIVGGLPAWALFAIASVYWGAGLAAGPAWNAWVTGIVPAEQRSPFLARRTRLGQFSLLTAIIAGGLALEQGKKYGVELQVFTGLFAVAGLSRLFSAYCLVGKTEVHPHTHIATNEQSSNQRTTWYANGAGMLLAYLWMMYLTAQISGPFFVPYLKRDIGCSYFAFMCIIGISILAKALVMPWAGRFAHQYGAKRLLIYSGLIIIPLSAMWSISREIPYILGLQIAAGLSWGAFELAIVLIFLECVPMSQRTKTLTMYNLGYAVASVLGSVAGGFMLRYYDNQSIGYYSVFIVSTLGRLLTIPLIRWLPQTEQHLTTQELTDLQEQEITAETESTSGLSPTSPSSANHVVKCRH
jgi:MFS family permease